MTEKGAKTFFFYNRQCLLAVVLAPKRAARAERRQKEKEEQCVGLAWEGPRPGPGPEPHEVAVLHVVAERRDDARHHHRYQSRDVSAAGDGHGNSSAVAKGPLSSERLSE